MATKSGGSTRPAPPGQVVLVLQGGGALGAYQAGVYQALHEAGIEPDWIIGTSIGAINGALIAGNRADERCARLTAFWDGITRDIPPAAAWWLDAGRSLTHLETVTHGIAGFFEPNPRAFLGVHTRLGIEDAGYYRTVGLRDTLRELVDFTELNSQQCRLSLGAVSVDGGKMHYFDTRDGALDIRHILASGALPPAFPAVAIDGKAYWDGGIYSNTPVEAVLDDKPRRSSTIFAVQLWNPSGPEPESIWQVLGRHKEIQYASRASSHLLRQEQIHRLRHVIRELVSRLPDGAHEDPAVKQLASYGCATRMHLVTLTAPRLPDEDLNKDIDFSRASVNARWESGYRAARRVLQEQPWQKQGDFLDGIVIHHAGAGGMT